LYGYPRDTSPILDRLAEECIVFDAAFSAAPLTTASISSLLTGRLPDEHGVHASGDLLPAEASTLAETLAESGLYRAAVVSNWVLRRRDEEAGVQQGFDHFDDRMEEPEENRKGVLERSARATTDAALDWLGERPQDAFFLWVHYQDPHGPYTPPEEFVALLDRPLTDEAPLAVGKMHDGNGALPGYQVLGEERRPEAYRLRYDAEIRYFDQEVGRLLEALEGEGLLEGALVLFTSDHGENLGEHDQWFTHGQNLHTEQLRIPLLMKPPGSFQRVAERVDTPVSHLDLFATVLDALDSSGPPTHGRSLLASSYQEDRILAHSLEAPDHARRGFAVTDARHRLVVARGKEQLYDRRRDPDELEDLSRELPERVEELREAYLELLASLPRQEFAATRRALSESELEQMDALGYGGEEED
jgi:arylsulfatase